MEDQLGRLMSIQISNITLLTSVKAGQMAAAVRQLLRNLIPSLQGDITQAKNNAFAVYSVIHISIHPSKELYSKMAPGEVGVSLP